VALSSRTNKHAHTERERERNKHRHARRAGREASGVDGGGRREASFVRDVFSREHGLRKNHKKSNFRVSVIFDTLSFSPKNTSEQNNTKTLFLRGLLLSSLQRRIMMEEEQEEDDENNNTNANFLLYQRLKRAWFDEQNAPILLKFKSELVERFSNLIASREAEIDEAEKEANESGDGTEMLLMSIAREELNRAKYVLRSYLRARIKKLQQFPAHYLQKRGEEEEDSDNTASEKEETFAEGLVEAYDKHAKSILSNFPSEYGDALIEFNRGEKPEMTMVSRPDEKNAMVFVRMLEDVGQFAFQNGENGEDRVDLIKGKIYWCKFDQFKGLLESSSGGELEEEEDGGGGGGGGERPRAELL
jgi:GINS complex subunit 4